MKLWLRRWLNKWRLRKYHEVGFVVDEAPPFVHNSRATHSGGGWIAPRGDDVCEICGGRHAWEHQ